MNSLNIICFLAIFTSCTYAQYLRDATLSPKINSQGQLEHVISLGNLTIESGITLPLHMYYNAKARSSALVPHYNIPLLEARAIKINENKSEVMVPDGRKIILTRRGRTDRYSASYPWMVTLDGSRLYLKTQDELLTYEAGKIKSWKMKNDNTINWVYGVDALEYLVDENGARILKVEQSAESLYLENGSKNLGINWSFLNVVDENRVQLFIPVLENYSRFGDANYVINSEEKNGFLKQNAMNKDKEILYSYSYNITSGLVSKLNGAEIQIKNVPKFETPQISLKTGDKSILIHKATSHDRHIKKELQADGSVITRNYFSTPTGRKLRKITSVFNETEKVLYRAYYNDQGQLLKDQQGEFSRKLINGKLHLYKNEKLIRKY